MPVLPVMAVAMTVLVDGAAVTVARCVAVVVVDDRVGGVVRVRSADDTAGKEQGDKCKEKVSHFLSF